MKAPKGKFWNGAKFSGSAGELTFVNAELPDGSVANSFAGFNSGQVVAQSGNAVGAGMPLLNASTRSLQHMFSRHAGDFGVKGNWNKAMATEFEGILKDHMKGITPIQGTYRGAQQSLHYFNPNTGLNVMTDINGNLIGGWKLSIDQIKYLLSTGTVK